MKKSLIALVFLAALFLVGIANAADWKLAATGVGDICWLMDNDSIEFSADRNVVFVSLKRSDQPTVVIEYVIDSRDNTFALYSVLNTEKGLYVKIPKEKLEWQNIPEESVIDKIAKEVFKRKRQV